MERLLMLAVLLSTAAQAATGVMTSNVNLRRTASPTGTVLTVVPKGRDEPDRRDRRVHGHLVPDHLQRPERIRRKEPRPHADGHHQPEYAPQPAQRADVVYANCTAAKAAGAAPIMRGQAGYRSKLDRDNDGVACE